jgi:predicted nuclease of predicted toxin-antitoxin system
VRLRFLADVNFNQRIVDGLRGRDRTSDILGHEAAGLDRMPDDEILALASRLGRVLLTHDPDFAGVFRSLARTGFATSGIIIARQNLPVGRAVEQIFAIWHSETRTGAQTTRAKGA